MFFLKKHAKRPQKLVFHHPLLKERNDLIPYPGAAQNKNCASGIDNVILALVYSE